MVGTEFLKGQGLGNQLFCYVSTKCMAIDHGYMFGTAGQEEFANNIHSQKGMYFMDIDLGGIIEKGKCTAKYEKEIRMKLPNNSHDRRIGCYISGADDDLINRIEDNTLIYGNLQSEKYFIHHKDEIKKWLKIDEKYKSDNLSQENVCILNMRGGEYTGTKDLYLKKRYWINAMRYMRKINNKMRFIIITEDVKSARMMFPKMDIYHLGMGEDYAAIHFAHYLIVSNSSFSFWPAFTSDTLKYIIAPKYWARHNCSDGYWASEQNIYTGWNYLGRDGKIYTAEQCRRELEDYKKIIDKKENQCGTLLWKFRVIQSVVEDFLYRMFRKVKRILYEKGSIH